MESLKKQAARLLGEQKKYRRWLTIFLCLAIVVTMGTVAALKMNGQALSHKQKVLKCGLEVHEHSETCYGSDPKSGEKTLICGYADYAVHVHNDDCYDTAGELVCQLEEAEAHTHEESCYEEQQVLVCELDESERHQHTENCKVLTCGKEEGAGHQHAESCRVLICTETESTGHEHGESCKALVCGQEEAEGHQHTDACRTMSQGDLICESTEEGHEHADSCYQQTETLTCGFEETEGHTHTDSCYDPQACGLEAMAEGHTHTESCYDPYGCKLEETEAHSHTEACYDLHGCKLEDGAGHTHTEKCFITEKAVICGKLELHTHLTAEEAEEDEESCYDAEGELICRIPVLEEHVHGEDCFETVELSKEEVEAMKSSTQEPEENGAESSEAAGTAGSSNGAAENTEDAGKTTETNADSEGMDGVFRQVFENEQIKVTAEYDETAGIPEGAKLYAEKTGAEESAGLEIWQEADQAEAGTEPAESGEAGAESTGGAEQDTGKELAESGKADTESTVGTEQETDQEPAESGKADTESTVGTEQETDQEPAESGKADTESTVGTEQDTNQESAETEGNTDHAESEEELDTKAETGSGVEAAEGKPESDAAGTVEPLAETKTPDPASASESADPTEEESETAEDPEKEQAEQTADEVTYRFGFRLNGKEIVPQGTVTFTIWNLEEENEPETIVYSAGDDLAALKVTLRKRTEKTADGRKTYEDETVRIIAEYGKAANIPENAELIARQITAESAPEVYAGYEEEFKEAVADENTAMTVLFNIGFYVDGKEIEPDDTVTIMIQFLDEDGNPTGKPVTGVHFGKDGAEVLESSEADEEGYVSFQTESFSPFGFAQVLLTSWVGFSMDDGGIPVYMLTEGEWQEVGKINAGAVGALDDPVTNIPDLFDIGYILESNGVDLSTATNQSRWIGISYLNGEEEYISTACYEKNSDKWVLDKPIAKSAITGVYYLPENEERFDKLLSELQIKGPTSCAVVFNPGNWNNSGRPQRKAYGTLPRVELEIKNPEGKAKIYLPGDNQLGSPYVLYTDGESNAGTEVDLLQGKEKIPVNAGGTITVANENDQGHSGYMHRLVGWYDVISKTYYEVGDSAREIEIDLSTEHIFYADWVAESYDFAGGAGQGDFINTEDTSDFVTTKVFDYNELFNIHSTSVKRVDESGKKIEEWEDNGIFGPDENTRSFIFWEGDARDIKNNGQKYDSSIFSAQTNNRWNGGGQNPMQIHEGLGTPALLSYLFLEGRDQAEGVHYIGEGNYLYQHVVPDGDKIGYYIYDSDLNSATYQQTEGRFYVGTNPQSAPNGSKGFFPFNGVESLKAYDVINNEVNYFFGMSSEINFYLPADSDAGSAGKPSEQKPNQIDSKDMTFEFSGDDDVWVYLEHDGSRKLILDIGGIHDKQSGIINFTTGEVITGKTDGAGNFISTNKQYYEAFKAGSYKMTVYYLERGAGESNCKIKFNIVPRYKIEAATANTLTAVKEWKNTDSAPVEYIELSLMGKANRDKFLEEDWSKLQKQLKLDDEQMRQYKADMERQLNQYSDTFAVIDTVKLATKGGESVQYTWEGLFPYCDYKVEEAEVAGYTAEIKQKPSGGSYDYWTETAALNSGEFLILNKEGTNALASKNGGVASEAVTVRYGVVVTQDRKDANGVVQEQGIIPAAEIWTAENFGKGFALKNKETSQYLSLADGKLQLSNTPYELNISDNLGDGLCDSKNRVVFQNGQFTALPNTGNSGTNTNTDGQHVRVYTKKNVASQVYHYTVTNTYTPNITIQKVDSKTGQKIAAEEDAQFTLTRITEGEADAKGNVTQLYAYYDGRRWIPTEQDAESVVGSGENGQETGWFSLTKGALAVKEFPGGHYRLTERKAPTGYKLPEHNGITFDIENGAITNLSKDTLDDGQTLLAEIDGNNSLRLLVRNEQEAQSMVRVCFTKYSNGSSPFPSPLSQAEFMLYRKWDENIDKGKNPDKQINGVDVLKVTEAAAVSAENGRFYTGELICGVYYLEEVKAPDGYNYLEDIIEIAVEADPETKKIIVSIDADKTPVTVAEVKELTGEESKEGDFELRVFNTYGFELPETGSLGTKPFTIGGAMLITAAAILMYGYSMRRRKSERRLKK